MPVVDRSTCREHPHTFGRQYLLVYRPATIFAARVDGGGVDPGYDVQQIPFDNVTVGVIGDVRRGYTVWIGSAAGLKDYGIIRVRSDGAGAVVNVSEHEIYLYDNAYITVKEEYRLWHVSPFLDVTGPTWYKDCDDVTGPAAIAFPGNIDDIYQPVPVMGPHSIEFLEAGVATHNFDWGNSWTISPNSGALTYAATFPDGTPPNSAASSGTVVWNTVGERWVTLALTDDMGASPDVSAYDAHRLYVTIDRDNLPDNVYVAFLPGPRQGTIDQGGFSMQFTVFVDAPEGDFPDEALVIWFCDGGTQADIGGNWPHRTHIKFIGYITRASTHKEPETGNVVFDATTIEGMMKTCPTFPNFMEDEAAPTVWTEAHDLTVQRAAYLHMRWMSSLLEMADVLFVPDADTTIGEHEFPEGFLYDQLNSLVNRDYLYRIGCDPLGTIYVNKDPQFLPRPAAYAPPVGIATIMAIEAQDWRKEIDLPEPLVLQTSHILASGNAYTAGTVSPLFSHAPGPVPLVRGRRDKSLSRLICTTQGAINGLSGLALAHANNDFPDVPIKMDGQYYVGHLFPMEFVEFDIQGLPLPGGSVEGTKRDVDLSSEKFIPRRSTLQIVYDKDGAPSQGLVDINVEKLTYGPAGRTLTYPVEPPAPPGPGDGPPDGGWLPPTPPNPSGDPADGNLLYFVDVANSEAYRTRNARTSNPLDVVYEALNFPGTGPRYITLDSWDPKNGAMICGGDGVWKTTNLDSSPPTWTHVIDATGVDLDPAYVMYMAASSICEQGVWMVSANAAGAIDDVYVFYTTNGGPTFADWSNILITATPTQFGPWPKIEASAHNAQVAWVTWKHNNGTTYMSKTVNQWGGKADSGIAVLGGAGVWPSNPHHRYLNNPTDLIAMWAGGTRTRLCTDDCCGACTNGAALGDVTWIGSYTWGTTRYWLLSSGAPYRFYISDDAVNWTLQFAFAGTTRHISGFSYNEELFYACQDGVVAPILISEDRGLNFQPQTGNWGAVQGVNPPQVYCCVPVWIE